MHRPGDSVPLVQAAQVLGVSWGQAWRFVLIGELAAERVGGRWQVDRASLDRLRAARANAAAPTHTAPLTPAA